MVLSPRGEDPATRAKEAEAPVPTTVPPDLVARTDRALGELLERLVREHHRRRLRKLGAAHALRPPAGTGPWVQGDTPPRPGNAVDVLIDGEHALPAIAAAIRG